MTGAGLTSCNDEPPGPGAAPTRRALSQASGSRPEPAAGRRRYRSRPGIGVLCLASASQRVSTCHSGIPARQQANNIMSRIFIQNQLIIFPSPAAMEAPLWKRVCQRGPDPRKRRD